MKVPSNKWLTKMLYEPKSSNLPDWLADIVYEECAEAKLRHPKNLTYKLVDPPAGYEQGYLGGYTAFSTENPNSDYGEIALLSSMPISLVRREYLEETILHEVVHWIRKDTSARYPGGHSPEFYSDLMHMVLKRGVDIDFAMGSEYDYMGDYVIQGMEMFNEKYNR